MQKVTPFLWYNGQAEEAVELYKTVIPELQIHSSNPMSVVFSIEGREFVAFNGGPAFKFTEAISLMISCDTQEKIDDAWEKLTANGGQESRCGWLKDKFGLSWQITPPRLNQMLSDPDREKANRAMQAMLGMNKLNIAELEAAYEG